ncbi:unnamed protein product, partial [Owenia fusiformis]
MFAKTILKLVFRIVFVLLCVTNTSQLLFEEPGVIHREMPFCKHIRGNNACAVYGGTLIITCEITLHYPGDSDASKIFFQYQSAESEMSTYPDNFTKVLSNITAQLRVPIMPYFNLSNPEDGHCHHFCMIREENGTNVTLAEKLTIVGRFPAKPHSIQCEWINWEYLDCTWQPASFKSKAVYTYVTASLKT